MTARATDQRRKALIDGLAVRGFVEGKNFIFEKTPSSGVFSLDWQLTLSPMT